MMKSFGTLLIVVIAASFIQVKAQQNSVVSTTAQSQTRNLNKIREDFYKSLGISDKDLEEYKRESARGGGKEEEDRTDGLLAQFHRWEWLMRTRVDANGNLPDPFIANREYEKYKANHPQFFGSNVRNATWEPVGSADVPSNGGGAGRTNVVEFDPNNSDIMYVGAAGGGLWKSEDAGATWNCLSDAFPVTGIADVAIDPANTNIIYAATGDGYGYEADWQGDNDFWGGVYTAGLMKSTDGGVTWSTTGLSFDQDNNEIIQRVIVLPGTADVVLVATRGGIYRSTDGGDNFTLVSTVHCYDFALKPTDPNTIYTGGDKDILVSTDAGATWTILADDLMGTGRTSVETTAANPDVIYAFNEGGKFKKSIDGGVTWENASKPSTQTSFYGYYDTDFGVSQVDENSLIADGLEVVVSNDGAGSWNNVSAWDDYPQPDYVHADGKCSRFLPGSSTTVFVTNDGGIFKSTDFGDNWTDLSDGLRIAQAYRLGTAVTNPDKVISGWQDNGCNLWDGTSYKQVYGADGMEAAIDPTDDNILYEESQYGGLSKSTDNGNNWTYIAPSGGDWLTPYIIDPVDHNTLYYGGSGSVFKTTNAGSSWTNLGGGFSGNLFAVAVAPSNTQYIYGSSLDGSSAHIKVSKNGGSTWTDIGAGLPTGPIAFNYIAIDNNDAERVWVAVSAYSDGNKVFHSEDAGSTWENVSGTLPNVPVNCVLYAPDSQDGIYVATDLGVFYRDNTMSDWIPFMDGLPNVMVHELEINPTSEMLVAATYGRGIWQSTLYGYVQYANDIGVTTVINPTGPVCVDNVTPSVKVKNFGSNEITSFDLNYSLDGGPINVYSWSGDLAPLGYITVTLPEMTPSIGEHTFAVYSSSPNGLADNNTINDADTSDFNVLEVGAVIPLTESYESGSLPGTWSFNNDDNIWLVTDAAGGYGQSTYSIKGDFFDVGSGKSDEMTTPYLDFTSGLLPITLKFDVAHANKTDTKGDTLSIGVSTDCGTTFTTVYYKGGADLETAPLLSGIEFVPASDQWITETVDLSSYAEFNRVLVKFKGISKKGNSMYIDNINLAGLPSTSVLPIVTNEFEVYPNPSNGLFEYQLPSAVDRGVIEVHNVLGQVIYKTEAGAIQSKGELNLSFLDPGVYELKIDDGNDLKLSHTIIIQR